MRYLFCVTSVFLLACVLGLYMFRKNLLKEISLTTTCFRSNQSLYRKWLTMMWT
eukprot:jgi/Botrbrau1/14645/Bobra.0108s0007.1